jgi:hypothetical protein
VAALRELHALGWPHQIPPLEQARSGRQLSGMVVLIVRMLTRR